MLNPAPFKRFILVGLRERDMRPRPSQAESRIKRAYWRARAETLGTPWEPHVLPKIKAAHSAHLALLADADDALEIHCRAFSNLVDLFGAT